MKAIQALKKQNSINIKCLFSTNKLVKEELPPVYHDLIKQVEKYRKELRNHFKSSFKHRYLLHSIDNLNQAVAEMECKRSKLENSVSDISQIPLNASIEILSNGLTHIGPSFVIKTPLKTYLFNCPEGTSRFLASLRVRPTNTCDFFITRAKWENIGGISGVLLSKEITSMQTRIHGPQKIKQYLECLRPFIDSDFGTTKYPVSVEELTYDKQFYEDAGLKVSYIPVFESNLVNKLSASQMVDVAYLIEFKAAPKKIDILKIINLKIPKGPLIGQLKAGNTITLPNGQIVKPEEVYSDVLEKDDKSNILVVDIENEEKLNCIEKNSTLKIFHNKLKKINYIIHFTLNELVQSNKYQQWMKSFGENCIHIFINGTGLPLPLSDGPYIHQKLLNNLNQDIFPSLYPVNFSSVVSQDYESVLTTNYVKANNFQRFPIRGFFSKDDQIVFDFGADELSERLKVISKEATNAIDEFKIFCKKIEQEPEDKYPSIIFLGTASAVPSKYRNVSGYLLQLNDNSNFLIDCGEGTYGQIRVLYGPDICERILLNLKALFITHAHQDHMNGLYLIIIKRIEAFKKHGLKYKPIVVVCNRNVRKPLAIYSRNFDDIEKFIAIIDISMFMKSSSAIADENIVAKRPDKSEYEQRVLIDVTLHLPKELYSAEEWNLSSIKAVQVHHTRMANGFIFVTLNNRKIVFSGDTMPCDLLVEKGKNANVLVHECTFEDGYEEDAFRKRHSTMLQAYNIGRRMNAENIIFSHFSARYTKVPCLPDYLIDAGNFSVAMDNMVARYDRLKILPKLLPLYRLIYMAELFDLKIKQDQKTLRKLAEEKKKRNSKQLLEHTNLDDNLLKV